MDGWARLGKQIARERSGRWRSRAEFARAAGLSARVVDDLERGRRANYTDATLAAVEAALGWVPGTALRVVQGGKVRKAADPALVRLLDAWPNLSPDARTLLAELAERAAHWRDGFDS